jgi:hypothetical protein
MNTKQRELIVQLYESWQLADTAEFVSTSVDTFFKEIEKTDNKLSEMLDVKFNQIDYENPFPKGIY